MRKIYKFRTLAIAFVIIFIIGFKVFIDVSNLFECFAAPNKILFYNDGKVKEIKKGSDLYNKILELTNKRLNDKCYIVKSGLIVSAGGKLEDKGMVLVFSYTNMRTTWYKGYSRKYNKILIPLSGGQSNKLYFDNGKGYYGSPIAHLSSPEELIKVLN